MPRRAAFLLLAAALLWRPPAAAADEMADKLCPILGDVAGSTQGFMPEAVQAKVVMAVAGAYDYDHDALMRVLDERRCRDLGRLPRGPRRGAGRHRQAEPHRGDALKGRARIATRAPRPVSFLPDGARAPRRPAGAANPGEEPP